MNHPIIACLRCLFCGDDIIVRQDEDTHECYVTHAEPFCGHGYVELIVHNPRRLGVITGVT